MKDQKSKNKYARIYELARIYNPQVSWFETAIVAIAADLEQYTGDPVEISGPFGLRCEISFKVGEHRSKYITVDFNGDDLLLSYDSGERTNAFTDGTIGAVNGFNNISKPLPDTIEKIIDVLLPDAGYSTYSKEYLEYLISGVVEYEAEEPGGWGRINLSSMGFSDDDMDHFGMPPYEDDEEVPEE